MISSPDKIEQIFSAALQLASEDEQKAYLDRVCEADQELRRLVEKLLRAQPKAAQFLEQPWVERQATVDDPIRERPGTAIGPYKLMEQIGEGGMGTVYLAQQTEPVKRLVALKVIKPGMDSRQVIARFEAERQALALMDHPNIARVFEAGTTDSGRPYFVMELVKGVPLTKYCDEHRLTPKDRLELFIPVCQAIQHAHQKGIIHRDIKPSNVLVASYDGKPVPKVIDFGVAKATGQQLTERTLLTGLGAMVGTLEYMSPEQAELNQHDIDTRSDIYSLGVLLYELLTGSTPLEKKRLKAAVLLELLRVIREEEPPKPSTRLSTTDEMPSVAANRGLEPKKLSGLVRGELDLIVMKALDKDRNRRYETASNFAADAQRYLNDEPVQACPPSAWYRFRKFARRNKTALATTGLVLLFILSAGIGVGWVLRDQAVRRAEGLGRLQDGLSAARTLLADNQPVLARQKLAEARGEIGSDRAALGSLAVQVEALEAELERRQRFFNLLDRAHEAEIVDGQWQPARAAPFSLDALAQYDVLQRDDWSTRLEQGALGQDQVEDVRRLAYEQLLWLADDVLRRRQDQRSGQPLSPPAAAAEAAVAYLQKAETARPPTHAFYSMRAAARQALGQEELARADWALAGKTPPTMAFDYYLQGQAAYAARDRDKGIEAFEAALRVDPKHFLSLLRLGVCLGDLGRGPEDFTAAEMAFTGCIMMRPDYAYGHSCRGLACTKLKQFDKALADYAKAIELDPRDALAWNGRGLAYKGLKQFDKAFADLSKSIELDPKDAILSSNRGLAYAERKQWDKAVADYAKAIELDPKLALAWYNRGIAYSGLKQSDRALADYSKAIELDPRFANAWCNRGVAYNELKQFDKALADLSKAIELDPKDTIAWSNRGAAYAGLKQWDKAIADYSKAIELDPKLTIAWGNRGFAYNELRQFDKALADYSKAIELDPKLANVWSNRGKNYCDLGQWDKALADLSQAIELDPKNANAWGNRGWAYSGLKQWDKAIDDLSKAIELDPKNANAWSGRGLAYAELKQWDKAIADLSKAIELDPKNANAWSGRGFAYNNLKQFDKAIADLSKAIELDPKDAYAWINRGSAYAKLKQLDKAIADYSKAIELDPKYAMVWNSLAWLLATAAEPKVRDPGRAVNLARKAVALAPTEGAYWSTLGTALYRAGDWKAARAALEKSMELRNGGDSFDWFFLAMAHEKLGEKEKARQWYDRATRWMDKNQPRDEELASFRAEAAQVLGVDKKKD